MMTRKVVILLLCLLCVAGCGDSATQPGLTALYATQEPMRRVYLPVVARGDELPLIFDCLGAVTSRDWLKERFGAVTWTQGISATLTAIYARCGDQPASVTVYVERDGEPAEGVTVVFSWPDGSVTGETNDRGEVGFGYGGGAYYEPPDGGPHSVAVGDCRVSGLGMIAFSNHAHVDLGFVIP